MRKICGFFLILLLLFSFIGQASPSYAQSSQDSVPGTSGISPDFYPLPEPTTPFLGQDHNYSVIFRGNGEAVVSLRATFTNKSDEAQTEVFLRIPKVEPKELATYQIIKDKVCIRYRPQVYDPLSRSYPQICEEYQEPNFYQSNYYGGVSKYQRAKFEYKGDTLTLTLPQAVAPNKSASFFVYFRAFGYAKKNLFGGYKYTFETAKVEDSIRNLQVGIATDSDLVLKGVKGEVAYRYEAPQLAGLDKAASTPAASAAIDSYVSQIGQGKITKTASNLSPLESYTVAGAYAKNRLILYAKELAIGVIVVVVILLLLFIIARRILKGFKETSKETSHEALSPNSKMLMATAGLGFICALLITGYTVGVITLGNLFGSLFNYYYSFQPLLFVFLLIISFCVYILLIFAPAILVGVKKGTGWGLVTVASTVIWLIVFSGFAVLIVFLLGKTYSPPGILPLMGGETRN